MMARFFLAKALFALIMIDILTPVEFYGRLFADHDTRRPTFWLTIGVVALLTATLLWLTRLLGRRVLREFRQW
jgi:hypothetical protein